MLKFCIKLLNSLLLLFLLIILLCGCKNESDELVVNDYLNYYNSEIKFTEHYYSEIGNDQAVIKTTVSVPSDISITDYGHCWITYNDNPTISDTKTSFGKTTLKYFTINSTVTNYNPWTTYYGRAYIITNKGIIYDITYYFPSK